MSIKKSDLTGLDRDKIFSDTFWLYYCCCAGAGVTKQIGDPLIGSEVKELCLHSACATADIKASDGLCGGTSVMCCITEHFQIPPMTGAPKCVCCGKAVKPGEGTPTDEFQGELYDIGKIFDGTFWLYYMLCCGLGVSGIGKDRPLFVQKQKMLIARQSVKLVKPVEDGILCSGLSKTCCFQSQLEFPPLKDGSPFIACCGWKKNKN